MTPAETLEVALEARLEGRESRTLIGAHVQECVNYRQQTAAVLNRINERLDGLIRLQTGMLVAIIMLLLGVIVQGFVHFGNDSAHEARQSGGAPGEAQPRSHVPASGTALPL